MITSRHREKDEKKPDSYLNLIENQYLSNIYYHKMSPVHFSKQYHFSPTGLWHRWSWSLWDRIRLVSWHKWLWHTCCYIPMFVSILHPSCSYHILWGKLRNYCRNLLSELYIWDYNSWNGLQQHLLHSLQGMQSFNNFEYYLFIISCPH